MKTKNILLLFVLILAVIQVKAQSHNTRPGSWCKFVKNNARDESESARCLACDATDKKEQAARDVENKRRSDVAKAEYEAKETVRKLALKKEKEERDAKNKVTEVSINMPKSTSIKNTTSDKKTEQNQTKSNRFMSGSGWNYFYDSESGDRINPSLDTPQFNISRAYGAVKIEGESIAQYLHPAEIGVILYNPKNSKNEYCNGWYLHNYDIVDYDIKPLFGDISIHHIEHFYENWFLIGYYPCDSYKDGSNIGWFKSLKLYNVETKKFINTEIDDTFDRLYLVPTTSGVYNKGVGDLVFHNRFFESGVYNKESKYKINGGYELLIDKLAGGNHMWKAAICILVKSSYDYYQIYLMSENNDFKSFKVDLDEFKEYSFK